MKGEKASHIRTMLLLLTSLSFLAFSTAYCPHPEDIYPCRCVMQIPAMLFCRGPNITISQVHPAFQTMVKSYPGFSLKLKNINIGKLDVNFFNSTMMNAVHFEDCNFKGFVDTASKQGVTPPYPPSITILNIDNSIHGDVEINLAPFQNVHYLSLSNNVIKKLETHWPINAMGPTTINLVNNSIESVDEDAFTPLTAVNILDMSLNRLRKLGRELRPAEANSLQRLDFSHNRISSISKYYFQDLPGLKYVSLSYNQIQVLDEKTWNLAWFQLDYINLEENPLSCGNEIKWIQGRQPESVRGTCANPADKKLRKLIEIINENNQSPPKSYLPEIFQGNFIQRIEEEMVK